MTASTKIEAAPEAVFAVLADPSSHAAIDGTGWVRDAEARDGIARDRGTQLRRVDVALRPGGNHPGADIGHTHLRLVRGRTRRTRYLQFPPFGQDHLDNSLQHLSDLVG